jgi:hypothetical protein
MLRRLASVSYLVLFPSLLVLFPALQAQRIQVGVQGALPLTDIEDRAVAFPSLESRYGISRFAIGPSIGVRLLGDISVETGFLYRKGTRYSRFNNAEGGTTFADVEANIWEVPLLLRYRLPFFSRSWFVQSGATLRRVGDYDVRLTQFNASNGAGSVEQQTFSPGTKVEAGFTAGAGYSFRTRYLAIEPEVRYMTAREFTFSPVRNQVDFVLGVRFPGRKD